ncbi:ABC transporter permease [Rhodococcus sp. USK10]|uniref:Possible membrane protein n=1 Tax=Rhodococcus wratislaviensis TaxID=44752 RepID=A0A402C4B6_RHOWR|nr:MULTISPECIES: ABC transporter permease [Rhodococcus]QYB06439.1 ABC transporter permease [Rhodococcus sp. USK10]GCE38485.1 possible membrane protein [Rhodococcus wratislaviensis]
MSTSDTGTLDPRIESAGQASNGPSDPVKMIAVVLGLTAVIAVMLLAFALPAVHSGPHDLRLGVAGPDAAVTRIDAALEAGRPGAFATERFADAEAVRTAIEHREVVGGIVATPEGMKVLSAGAGGAPIAQTMNGLAAGMSATAGQPVPVEDVVPLTADDPAGAGLGGLALPLVFGGMIPAIVLVRLFPHSVKSRVAGAVLFAVSAGLALTAILQFGLGSVDGDYWTTSGAVILGIAAISLTVLGLESVLGIAGFALGAVTMMFLANPLSGLATSPAWLPSGWGAFGQLLPPGAAGTVVRSTAFFDGHGAGAGLLVLSCWILFGLGLCVVSGLRERRAPQEPAVA